MPPPDSAPPDPIRTVFDRETTLTYMRDHQGSLVRFLRRPLGATLEDAEDAVSEVFADLLAAASAGAPLGADTSPIEYLRSMAKTQYLMDKRHRKDKAGPPQAAGETADPSQRQPESILIGQEQLQKVRERWNRLSDKERELLTIVDQEGLALGEAAQRMGLAYKDASITYERAHRQLEEELGRNWSTYILPAQAGAHKPRTREGLLRIVEKLPPEYRGVVGLTLGQGLDEREVARRLGLGPDDCRRRVDNGLGHLMKMSGMTMDEIRASLERRLGG
jgi:RNA polymerase sigma factor (sigma-70 family)